MSEENRCPECGAPLPARGPLGLCPGCLLKRGIETAPPVPEPGQASGEFCPPTPELLAAQFPDLEILEFIGRGGMGMVYKARQKHLDRLVALKILLPNIARDPAFAERFTREARAMAMLSHPHIVTVYDFGQTSGREQGAGSREKEVHEGAGGEGSLYYFLMEFVDGLTLRQLLDAGKLAPAAALAIVPQICEALQFAHDKGVVHRDIKPENILMDRSGQVKIADFGLAKLVGKVGGTPMCAAPEGPSRQMSAAPFSDLTGAGQVMGTPHYMAPEQIEHPQEVDHRADIYSLGVVFYQMLTGELPIGRFAPPSQRVQVDVRLDEVVLRALEKEPQLRYQQASEIKTSIEFIATTPATLAEDRIREQKPSTPGGTSFVERRDGKSVIVWPGVITVFLATFGCAACAVILLWLVTAQAIPLGGSLIADFLLTIVFVWSGIRTARRQLETADAAPRERGKDARQPIACPTFWWVAAPLVTLASAVGLLYVRNGCPARELLDVWVPWLAGMLVLAAALFAAFWSACRTRSPIVHWGATGVLFVFGVFGAYAAIQGGDELSRVPIGIQAFFCLVYFVILVGVALQGHAFASTKRSHLTPSLTKAKPAKWWRLVRVVVLIALVAGVVRTFVAQSFVVAGSGVEPELPRGSRILVWKMSGAFTPGDLVAYHHEDAVFAGRVASADADEVRIDRNKQPEEVVDRRRVIGKVFSVYWRPPVVEPTQAVAAAASQPPVVLDQDQLSSLEASVNACSLRPVEVNRKTFGTVEVLLATQGGFQSYALKATDYGLPADASAEQIAAKADRGDLYLTLSAKDGPAANQARLVPLRGATFFPLQLPRIEPESPNWSCIDRLKRMTRSQIAAAADAFLEAHPDDKDRVANVSEGQKYALVRPDGETFVLSIGELSQDADGGNRQLQLSMVCIGRIPWGTSFSVVDTQGKPIAGATATFSISERLKKEDGVATYGTHSMGTFHGDDQGCVRLPPLPRGTTFSGAVAAAGFFTRDDISGARDKDGHYYPPGVDGRVQLKRPGAIEGQVLDPGGKPLVHAPLSLTTSVKYPNSATLTANHLRAITDDQGRFRVEGVPPGQHFLYYPWDGPTRGEVDSDRWRAFGTKKDGHISVPLPLAGYGLLKTITVEEGKTVTDELLDFSQSTAAIEGKVLDAAGKPVSGASVRLLWPRGDGTNWMSLDLPDIVSNAKGRYRIEHLPPGSFQLQVIPPGMKVAPQNTPAPVHVELTANQTLQQDLRLAPAGS